MIKIAKSCVATLRLVGIKLLPRVLSYATFIIAYHDNICNILYKATYINLPGLYISIIWSFGCRSYLKPYSGNFQDLYTYKYMQDIYSPGTYLYMMMEVLYTKIKIYTLYTVLECSKVLVHAYI